MYDSLEMLTDNAYECIAKAVGAKGGKVSMDVNHFGDLNLLCRWKNRRSWRIATKQYSSFNRAEGWVSLYTAEKLMAQANMNFELAVLAFIYPDDSVEFFSIRSGRRIKVSDSGVNKSAK